MYHNPVRKPGSLPADQNRSPNTTTAALMGRGRFAIDGWHRILFIGLLAITMMAGPATAATLTVAADGTGDYPLLSSAVAAAANGDTIYIRSGTYTETAQLTISKSDIRIVGENVDTTIINIPKTIILMTGTGGSFENLTLTGDSKTSLRLYTGSSNCIVKKNRFLNVGGIQVITGYNEISDNLFVNPTGTSGAIYLNAPAASFNTIRNNTVVGSATNKYRLTLSSASSNIIENRE